tara:strand:- start:8086 stop:8478 length:393 start_codon:yes stop_codon:yes gene_type:complete
LQKVKSIIAGSPKHPSELFDFHIDVSFNHLVSGWAYKKSDPTQPVHVAFRSGERLFCEVIADQQREDLTAAGLPTDSCAFKLVPDLPQGSLTPTLADLYLDGVKVNKAPIIFSENYDQFVRKLEGSLFKD